jgi:NitT/TauT family transport system substrate-binding protein
MRSNTASRFVALFGLLIALLFAPLLAASPATSLAQEATPLSCTPGAPAGEAVAATPSAVQVATPADDALDVTIGYVPASVFAPIFVAKEKGYFAEEGLNVTLEPLPGGSDMVALTATGDFDAGIGGAGPAFWNALALGLPIKVIAPGHAEGNPVATPLMISKKSCESGAIKSVADLKGKKVSVNARGATEYWLAAALATAGLTLDDIDLQTLAFSDAVAALEGGAVDAAMVGEPLATAAEQNGIAVRLLTDFPVQDIQPTIVFANSNFLAENPEAATGIVTAYLKACRDLAADGFSDPATLAIIEQYTGVPATLVSQAVRPVYAVDGHIDLAGLGKLQTFFRERGQLEYDTDLDPATFVDTQYIDAALEKLGPA